MQFEVIVQALGEVPVDQTVMPVWYVCIPFP